jgi:hypothetical protein
VECVAEWDPTNSPDQDRPWKLSRRYGVEPLNVSDIWVTEGDWVDERSGTFGGKGWVWH